MQKRYFTTNAIFTDSKIEAYYKLAPLKILHCSAYNIQCGIFTFLNDFIKRLEENSITDNDIIPIKRTNRRNAFSYIKSRKILTNNFKL